MGERYYLYMRPDEDGNPATILTKKELLEYLEGEEPDAIIGLEDYLKLENKDPNYWGEDVVLVCEVKPAKIRAAKYDVEEE